MDVERRRSARVHFSEAQAAVMQVGGREIPVQIVDISASGALVTLLDVPAASMPAEDCGENVVLSMNLDHSVFHASARVVRRTPKSVALAFADALSETLTGTFSASS